MNPAEPGSKPSARRAQVSVRWLLGALFLLAGALKIPHPGDFHTDLLAYDVDLPEIVFRLIAIAFPWLEVICGAALLANFWPETVRFLVLAMCLIFVLMLGQAVLRGLDLNCGCFGTSAGSWFNRPITALARAGLLLGVAGWLLCQPPSKNRPSSVPETQNFVTTENAD